MQTELARRALTTEFGLSELKLKSQSSEHEKVVRLHGDRWKGFQPDCSTISRGVCSKTGELSVAQEYEEGDYRFVLITEVVSLLSTGNAVSGIYSQDHVTHVFHRGRIIPVPRTVQAAFSSRGFNGKTLLTVVEKK